MNHKRYEEENSGMLNPEIRIETWDIRKTPRKNFADKSVRTLNNSYP